jgi:hypothetical protein
MIKAKFGTRMFSETSEAQMNEVLQGDRAQAVLHGAEHVRAGDRAGVLEGFLVRLYDFAVLPRPVDGAPSRVVVSASGRR